MSARMHTPVRSGSPVRPSFTPAPSRLLQRQCACGGSAGLAGECADCQTKRLTLQRRGTHPSAPETVPRLVHEVLRSPGQPLDASTRAFFEPRFGHDFSQVRVHTDAPAAASAQAVNALAYTVGRDIVFGAGQYTPQNAEGRRLLAHELAHTMQQRHSSYTPGAALQLATPSESRFEQEAAEASESLRSDGPPHTLSPAGSQVQRQAAAPASAPARPRREHRANLGRGGGRFDADLDRDACLFTATMKVRFVYANTPQAWPSEEKKTNWRDRFVARVVDRWSGRYDLAPSRSPCAGETCERLAVLLRVVPVTSGQHFTVTAGYSTSFQQSYVSGRTATLDYLDVEQRSDMPQVPAEHEFGHMLGLPHVHCDRNDDVCYGVTDAEQDNVMGRGSEVSTSGYGVFSEAAEQISNCGWRPVPRPSGLLRGLAGAGIGALVGGFLGAFLGPVGALVGGLLGAVAGGLIGGLTR
jgi:uncharacterized protein DUF4157